MKYWLMKNEPEDYSIDNLKNDKTEPWDGIRNYQVRNMIRDDMKKGDQAFCKESYPDHTAFNKKAKHYDKKSKPEAPTWLMVDVKFKRKLKRVISLTELKSHKKLSNMKVVQRGNRLSITEVSKQDWLYILSLEK